MFLFLVCVRAVLLLLCPFYNPVGIIMFSSIVCGLVVFLVVVHYILCYVDILCYRRSLFVAVLYNNDVVLSSWL